MVSTTALGVHAIASSKRRGGVTGSPGKAPSFGIYSDAVDCSEMGHYMLQGIAVSTGPGGVTATHGGRAGSSYCSPRRELLLTRCVAWQRMCLQRSLVQPDGGSGFCGPDPRRPGPQGNLALPIKTQVGGGRQEGLAITINDSSCKETPLKETIEIQGETNQTKTKLLAFGPP